MRTFRKTAKGAAASILVVPALEKIKAGPAPTAPANGALAQCWEAYLWQAGTRDFGPRGSPAFVDGGASNNYMYTIGVNDSLKAYQFTATNGLGTFNTTAIKPSGTPHTFNYPGAVPSVTWDGSNFSNALVWAVDTRNYGQINYDSQGNPVYSVSGYAQVYAYAAQPSGGSLGTPLFTDTTHGPGAVKFAVPTVANGMLFVAGGNNNPFYDPGTTNGTTNCVASGPTNCGMLVIWH